jgi:hypothetical protein
MHAPGGFAVTRSHRSLQLDTPWIFWRLFWLVFVVCQFAIWHHLRRRLPQGMGNRNFLMHMVIPSALYSLFVATLVAAGLTFLAFVMVKLVVGPLLSSWLTPSVDPTAVLFHLAPGEVSLASMPARRRWGWRWQPGSIVLTDRRIWFLPMAWDQEPYSASRSEVAGCTAELPALAMLAPIRNWPEHVRLGTRDGCESIFAVADAASLLKWFEPAGRTPTVAFPSRNLGRGAFDV